MSVFRLFILTECINFLEMYFQIYEGGYHALHHDLPEVAESVLKDVTSWITERLPAATTQGL